MCTTCGCNKGDTTLEGQTIEHHHRHQHAHGEHSHDHAHEHSHYGQESIDFGANAAGHSVTGIAATRLVKIEQDILAKNNHYANDNRAYFKRRGIFALNLVSSPGSGKTTLLVKTILAQQKHYPNLSVAVIEGDQQTDNDARRIRETGVNAIQINTGKGCHLDAHMIAHALAPLKLLDNSVLMIENVGNLVCPAAFDLGEAHKVAILSVTEGEDKPLKYPDMFRAADIMLLNKCDLLPHLSFDVEQVLINARKINPNIQVIKTSATNGEGIKEWLHWISAGAKSVAI